MYASFFGLNEKPFAITPNPRYLYMSERHAEALAHLMYGLNEAGGFIQLTGEVGTGKTTVVRTLLEQLPQHADVAVVLNPRLSPLEFLLTICEELGIFLGDESAHSGKDLVDILNSHLLSKHAKGRRVVVIIDEAQNLSPETLEQVRLLTNLETPTQKLLQIILIGQPELRELLARSELRQLAQRITARYHLAPLSREDTTAYVRHRIKVAGAHQEIFTERALRAVHRLSGGVPRLINIISDRALLGGYTQSEHIIGANLVRKAASEVSGSWRAQRWWPWLKWVAVATGVMVIAAVAFLAWRNGITVPAKAAPVVAMKPVPIAKPVVAPPAKPIPLDIAAVLKEFPQATGTDGAFSALFGLWNVSYDAAKGHACDQAMAAGVECVYQKGAWGQLRSLNRPAILQLSDDEGGAHQVVVAALSDTTARLVLDKTSPEVTVASISRYWNGDYLVLWRPQVNGQRTLTVGMRGADIGWLRSTLAILQGNPNVGQGKDLFDDGLAKQVADFQREHRLQADGVAGVQTQIALDALTNRGGGPVLQIAPGG